MRGRDAPPLAIVLLAAAGAALFILPVASLVWRTPVTELWTALAAPEAVSALRLSLACSLAAAATSVVLGLPLAWLQARTTFRGQRLLRAVTTLPIVLPPVVAGVLLLVVFGRRGVVGIWLDRWLGVRLPFTAAGAALAETFVAMPFFVLTMEGALRSVDRRLEDAARTLGASPWTVFRSVTLPLVLPSLQAGAVLAWARALGEFGATITFAGNVAGRTQTLPLAVYVALETRPESAFALSVLLLAVSLAVLVGVGRRWLPE